MKNTAFVLVLMMIGFCNGCGGTRIIKNGKTISIDGWSLECEKYIKSIGSFKDLRYFCNANNILYPPTSSHIYSYTYLPSGKYVFEQYRNLLERELVYSQKDIEEIGVELMYVPLLDMDLGEPLTSLLEKYKIEIDFDSERIYSDGTSKYWIVKKDKPGFYRIKIRSFKNRVYRIEASLTDSSYDNFLAIKNYLKGKYTPMNESFSDKVDNSMSFYNSTSYIYLNHGIDDVYSRAYGCGLSIFYSHTYLREKMEKEVGSKKINKLLH